MHSSLPFQLGTWNKTGNIAGTWTWCLSWSTIWDILQPAQIRSTTFWNSTNASPSQSYITLEIVESGNGSRGVRTIFEGWLFARSIVRLRLDFPSSPCVFISRYFRSWTTLNANFDLVILDFLSFLRIFIQYFHLIILLNNYYDKIVEELSISVQIFKC